MVDTEKRTTLSVEARRCLVAKRNRKKYSREFKIEAVKMMDAGVPNTQIARELGVDVSMLYRWRTHLDRDAQDAFPGKGNQTPEQAEITNLRKEVERLRNERDFLKKTAIFFARDSE